MVKKTTTTKKTSTSRTTKTPIKKVIASTNKAKTLKPDASYQFHIALVVLLVLNLAVGLIWLFSKGNVTSTTGNTENTAIWVEQLKAGGEENFELVKELYEMDEYKQQQKQAIERALGSFKNQPAKPTAQQPEAKKPAADEIDTGKADADLKKKFAEILKKAPVQGDKKARLTILEYSEFLCPFCQRQHTQGIVEKVVEKYPKSVNRVYRHFIVHPPLATKIAEGAECAKDQKGVDGFYEYIDVAFGEGRLNESFLSGVVAQLDLDDAKFNKCLEDGKYTAEVNAQTEEGRELFSVSGTPGNVIIDNETGKFVLIPGAYPVEKFEAVVKELLAE